MTQASGVLIVAEATAPGLASTAAELAAIGGQLADDLQQPLIALVMGSALNEAAAHLASLGPSRVIVVEDARLATYEPEIATATLVAAIGQVQPSTVLLAQTPDGRNLAARLAFRLDTAAVTDCTGLRVEGGSVVMTKPVYGGNAKAEYVVESTPRIATVRPRVFEPAAAPRPTGEIVQLQAPAVQSRLRLGETVQQVATAGPNLKTARVVVSGGRGMGGPENWHYVEELASALDAAIGATRAVTDAGWVPPGLQVGLTGVTITPDLYVTVALSGAVQHIAGCSGSRNIVAINKDADANIFKHARFGVVGDWKQVLPALTAKIKELRG
ncbi:MAG: electron transfer flavoprotein subunit alpha/FixB family protein [Chloroflexi bacterium]|nr:electron transfer flavoprotein subunit alpha/FixB family protein [Chloroflexota bacterium]